VSVAAVGVAAAGYLAPVAGARFQGIIDLTVILNAIRALHD
jgi:cation transport ATPase